MALSIGVEVSIENGQKFKGWIDDTIYAGKKELDMTDRTIFYILATEALELAIRLIVKEYVDNKD